MRYKKGDRVRYYQPGIDIDLFVAEHVKVYGEMRTVTITKVLPEGYYEADGNMMLHESDIKEAA